jgi:hypothetical protein
VSFSNVVMPNVRECRHLPVWFSHVSGSARVPVRGFAVPAGMVVKGWIVRLEPTPAQLAAVVPEPPGGDDG